MKKFNLIKKLNNMSVGMFILSIFLSICMVIGITFGVYTSVTNIKRLIYTSKGNTNCFSSNRMTLVTKDTTTFSNTSGITFPTTISSPQIIFNVCNYVQGNQTYWAGENIIYDLKVTIVDENNYPISANSEFIVNDVTKTMSQYISYYTLNGNAFVYDSETSTYSYSILNNKLLSSSSNKHDYVITIAKDLIDQGVYYRLEAITTEKSGYTSYKLQGICSTSFITVGVLTGWTHSIVEKNAVSLDEIYGINVNLQGSGEQTVYLSYKHEYLTLNERFLADIGEGNYTKTVNNTTGWTTIQFIAGTNTTNYKVQFYFKKLVDDVTWDNIDSYIKFPDQI